MPCLLVSLRDGVLGRQKSLHAPSLLTNSRGPVWSAPRAPSDPWVPRAWLCLLWEAQPPSRSPRFQFYIHTLKTFGKSESSLAICLFHFYYVCNKKKNQEEIESKLQILRRSPGQLRPFCRRLCPAHPGRSWPGGRVPEWRVRGMRSHDDLMPCSPWPWE